MNRYHYYLFASGQSQAFSWNEEEQEWSDGIFRCEGSTRDELERTMRGSARVFSEGYRFELVRVAADSGSIVNWRNAIRAKVVATVTS